jgi:hypothetical protein
MKIELQVGEDLVINLGERGTVVIQWTLDLNVQLDDNCTVTVFSQPDTLLKHKEIRNTRNPEGAMEIQLEQKYGVFDDK